MHFVLDASVTINWAMPDEFYPTADRAWEEIATGSATVPSIWWYEVRNILVVNERRQRISTPDSARFLDHLLQFSIDIDNHLDSAMILDLSRRLGRTVYDCAYLALAMRQHLPLATLDTALQAAAAAVGVPLLT
jgi:predicted nucleic acid-binding protein